MNLSQIELREAMQQLDKNKNGTIERDEFARFFILRLGNQKRYRTMATLQKRVAKRHGIFFGFSYDDWVRGQGLLEAARGHPAGAAAAVRGWSAADVALFVATHKDLQVVRSYLSRDSLADVDGEVLLELDAATLQNEVGVKALHVNKFLRVIADLRLSGGAPAAAAAGSGRAAARAIGGPGGAPRRSNRRAKMSYELGEIIGQGSFGRVYRGLDTSNGRMIAIKEMAFSNRDGARIKQLQREIEVMRKLQHPNIVEYLGAEVKSNALLVFSEWVPGGSLDDLASGCVRVGEGARGGCSRRCPRFLGPPIATVFLRMPALMTIATLICHDDRPPLFRPR